MDGLKFIILHIWNTLFGAIADTAHTRYSWFKSSFETMNWCSLFCTQTVMDETREYGLYSADAPYIH